MSGPAIDEALLSEQFTKSGGPGGQNVNKVETAVQLYYDLAAATLPERVKRRARDLAGSRLTDDGRILIRANEHRTREANREAARARLAALLAQAARPVRYRVKTRPSLSAKRKRTDRKVQRGRKKALRKPPSHD